MIAHVRVVLALARPAVVVLVALFAVTGAVQGGGAGDHVLMVQVLATVIAFLLFAVAVNDLADTAIDRVNLAGDPSRPLVSGDGTRRTFVAIACASGVAALALGAVVHRGALVAVAGGLVLASAYSLRPVRLADRGAVASMLLPAGYVVVPFLVGVLGARGSVVRTDLVLLGGLYLGFIGRILLKDFRDVRGDALFGKRTFLVRKGRRRTCAVSAVCWMAGTSTLLGVRDADVALVTTQLAYTAAALVLLRMLAVDGGPRRDERIITAVALVGRGMIVALIAHLSMSDAAWPVVARGAVTVSIGVIVLDAVRTMLREGPRTRSVVPAAWPEAHTSSSSVTGPSLTSSTSMGARTRPVATVAPIATSSRATASTSGSACSGRAASIQDGRLPLDVSP